jgi:hypothetical protein
MYCRRRVFRASLQAVANKIFIFHANGESAKLAETLSQLRKMDHDDESALARLMFTKSLETPIERACADEAGVGAVR